MAIRQVSVFVENRKGALADVLRSLSAEGVGLRALSIADTRDFGILRIITDDNRRAAEILSEQGAVCSVTEVVAAAADDKHVDFLSVEAYLMSFIVKDKIIEIFLTACNCF